MSKEDREAEGKLAQAMNNLASAITVFQDPVKWQKVISDALRMGTFPAGLSAIPSPLLATSPVSTVIGRISTVIGRIEEVTVSLTDEERARVVSQVYDALRPQIAEFSGFVRAALQGMPAHRLKAVQAKIEAGETPVLRRRSGCVFIEIDGVESYLGL